MAFIGTQIVIGVKGVDDPFTLIRLVKEGLRDCGDRRQRNSVEEFTRAAQTVLDYTELLAVCDKYVVRDESKERDIKPESRKMYNDVPVPSRDLIWKVAEMLLTHSTMSGEKPEWTVMVFEDWTGPELWLNSTKIPHVGSPTLKFEDRHSVMMAKIKSTHGPLILNTTIPKALLNITKITDKLIEHGRMAVAQRQNRENADQKANYNKAKAARLVTEIEHLYGLKRYYEDSRGLRFTTEGIVLEVEPDEYGNAVMTVKLAIGNEVQLENLEPIVSVVKAIKLKNDLLKPKEAKV